MKNSVAAAPAHVVIMSGSPAQVRELVPDDIPSQELAALTRRVVTDLAEGTPVELVASQDRRWYTRHTGSLRAWGAPQVEVAAGNHLAEIVQRYVLGPDVGVGEVRMRVGKPRPGAVTVVAVDGSAGMTPRAPLALLDSAAKIDEQLRGLLAGQTAQLNQEELAEGGVVEPDVWLELAQLAPAQARLLYADTHTGVGRYLAHWVVQP